MRCILLVLLLVTQAAVLSLAQTTEQVTRRNPCDEFCQNGGTCLALYDDPECQCLDGFSGKKCEDHAGSCPAVEERSMGVCGGVMCTADANCTIDQKCCPSSDCDGNMCTNIAPPISRDPCRNVICENGGTCLSPLDFPYCLCASGFGGDRCEMKVKSGICPPRNHSSGIGFCAITCQNDYDCKDAEKCCKNPCGGTQCSAEIEKDPCDGFCENGGTCLALRGNLMCLCTEGFSGSRCEDHDGSCPAVEEGSMGVCGGVMCTVDVNCTSVQKCCPSSNCGGNMCTNIAPPVSRNPCTYVVCENGGVCTSPLDVGYCLCPSGFGGKRCEMKVKPGLCPSRNQSSEIGICAMMCQNDYDCADAQKCCRNACGSTDCTPEIQPDPCDGFCDNGGICFVSDNIQMCHCMKGFSGSKCEDHAGSCPVVEKGGMGVCGGVMCTADANCAIDQKCCPAACGGNLCTKIATITQNPCDSVTCENGGTCTSESETAYCQCPYGFRGDRCERTVKPGRCLPPSQDGDFGLCGGVMCTDDDNCTENQKCCESSCGDRLCTNPIMDPCEGFVCHNGGVCSAPADAPMCMCAEGYAGDRCDIIYVGSNHAGSCPAVEDGGMGICGGVMCTVDDNCTDDEKCCRSACGGYMCTKAEVTPSTCANMLCAYETKCRTVVSCPTCKPTSSCIPKENVKEDTDSPCQNMMNSQIILVQDPDNSSSYHPLGCNSSQSDVDQTCPRGSTCVDSRSGAGSCCSTDKPGVCPTGEFSVCGGVMCSTDNDCPGAQKCCAGCGRMCTDPVVGTVCGNSVCTTGETCVHKQRPCTPGFMCLQALIPTCVPNECSMCAYNETCSKTSTGYECTPQEPVDQCGGCDDGEICINTGIVCVMAPCPTYKCVPDDGCHGCPYGLKCIDTGIRCVKAPCPSYQCVPDNECGGCPKGRKCIDTGIRCVKAPCPTYQCVPDDGCDGCSEGQVCKLIGSDFVCTTESDPECPLLCPAGYACELQRKKCLNSYAWCDPTPMPKCARIKPDIGNCPRVTWRLQLHSLYCLLENIVFRKCRNDNECPRADQRCCSSVCGISRCTTVNSHFTVFN